MFGLGAGELIVIFLVVFLLFGPKALPEIAKGLGQAIRAFKKEAKDVTDEIAAVSNEAKMDTSNDFQPSKDKLNWRPQTHDPNEKK